MIEEFRLLFKSKNAFLKFTLRVFSLACNEESRRPKTTWRRSTEQKRLQLRQTSSASARAAVIDRWKQCFKALCASQHEDDRKGENVISYILVYKLFLTSQCLLSRQGYILATLYQNQFPFNYIKQNILTFDEIKYFLSFIKRFR